MPQIKIKKVINAYGKMTVLGGSILKEEVIKAMNKGAENFFDMKTLSRQFGRYLSERLNVEETMLVSSASSGIAIAVGACIAKTDLKKVMHPYQSDWHQRGIVMMKGHNINYGTSIQTAVELGGGVVIEAGSANLCTKADLKSMLSPDICAILYVKSHHCVQKGMLQLDEVVAIAKTMDIPVIVDAAAEGDLKTYYQLGADMVIYSGTKALEGPTSGLILTRTKWIEALYLQNEGIGRILKIGKENMFGLVEAIDMYLAKEVRTISEQKVLYQPWLEALNQLSYLQASFKEDDAGRELVRIQLQFQSAQDAKLIADALINDDTISVYTRDYHANEGYLELDLRAINDQSFKQLLEQLKKKLHLLEKDDQKCIV